MVHRRRAGQKRGNDKADREAANKGERHADPVDVKGCGVVISYRVSEAQLADKGRKRGGEKGNVNVLTDFLLHYEAIKNYADKRRPHIEKIETVEAMRHHKHVSCEDGSISPCAADVDDKVGAQAADRRIEQRAAEAAEREIIGDELAGRGEYPHQIFKEVPLLGIDDGNRSRRKKEKTDKQRIQIDKSVAQLMLLLRHKR